MGRVPGSVGIFPVRPGPNEVHDDDVDEHERQPDEKGASGVSRPAEPRSTAWIAWVGLVAGMVLASSTVVAHTANRDLDVGRALPDLFQAFWLINSSSGLLFSVTGWFLATRRPGVIFGWLALVAGVAHGLAGAGLELAVAVELGHRHLPLAALGLWVAAWCPLVEQPILMVFYGLYPDGRLPGGWKRWVVVAAIALAVLGVLNAALDPSPGRGATVGALTALHNPMSLPFARSSESWAPAFFAPSALAILVVLLLRWRRAREEERRVLSWLVAFLVPATVIIPVSVVALPPAVGAAVAQGSTVLEVSIIVAATLRHHVYGIEVVLNRTLVYASLTLAVAAAYGAAIGFTGLLGAGGSGLAPFVAALAAAFVLAPARGRIQRGVNRLLYGQRDEPYAVVSRVASELTAAGSAEQLLPALASAIATALRVPYVGVELHQPGGQEVIAHGTPPDEVTRIPLIHQGRTTGALIVGHRPGQREVPRREQALLHDLASQAAVAAANVLLTEDLRRSRERIVTTREEERRRLRNDLHDGLGPQLTGVALGLDLVAEGAQAGAPGAAAAAERLRAELEDAIADVRRLVQGLRPPRLDEVGLCGALQEVVSRAGRSGLRLSADLPEAPLILPAAVEVAVYRIATEAITNAVRHSGARTCTLLLRIGPDVHLQVIDDGTGCGASPSGIGTTSMRERAEELGGTCTIGPSASGGCLVESHVPLAGR